MENLWWILISLILILFLYLLRHTLKIDRNFFERQGIKCKKPVLIIGTTDFELFLGKKSLIDKITEDYNDFSTERVVGLFDFKTPLFFIRCPEVIKQLGIKDFSYFQDHRTFTEPNPNDLFSKALFLMKGKEWRDMRSSLSPLFTGSKMRNMLQLINKCTKQLVEFINDGDQKNGMISYNTKDLFSKYTNDVIATCAFGVECDSLRNPKNEIFLIGQKMMDFQKPTRLILFFFMRLFPAVARALKITFIDRKTNERFFDLIINTMDVRKKNGIVRPDMIQLLMKLRDGQISEQDKKECDDESTLLNSEEKSSWSDMELIAQCFLFFLAGFDTSSTVMNFMAYELAIDPDIQERLAEEVRETFEALPDGELHYEALHKMKYMDMVICEVLRKWPPAVAVDRECVSTYNYEDDSGLKFTVEKGNMLWFPIYALHMDPKHFPNPEKFDPERFNHDEIRANMNMNAYLPFGVGPRNCIGLRFAMMEIKALFFQLLLNFEITAAEETLIPMRLKKSTFALIPEKEIKLYMKPRKRNQRKL